MGTLAMRIFKMKAVEWKRALVPMETPAPKASDIGPKGRWYLCCCGKAVDIFELNALILGERR